MLYLLLASPGGLGTHLGVLAALLIATLLGFVATHFALRALLAPVRLASSSLESYLHERSKPEMPIGFSDEAGKLMAAVQHAVDHLDSTIRSLEGLSGTDHLTGLPNRREGEVRLAEDHARAKRGGAFLTVAVGDVDNFKAINDTHGHQAGDVCLRQVAQVIRRNVREGDWLARWGRGRVRLVVVGRFCFRLARSGAGAHQRGPQAEPGAPTWGRGAGAEHQRRVRTGTQARTIYGNCWQRRMRPCTRPRERDEGGCSPARAPVARL